MWGFSSHQFVKEALCVVELELNKVDKKVLSIRASIPMYANYCSEVDVTSFLDTKKTNYYQELIGLS